MLLPPPSVQRCQPTHDKASIADLVALYGSSNATTWLENSRYKIWRPSCPIPESDFLPVQGYMRKGTSKSFKLSIFPFERPLFTDRYVFAWGNPLVSHSAALRPTACAFRDWAESQELRLVWCCVDQELEHVLAEPPFKWSAVTCIYEDIVDPAHVVWLASSDALGTDGTASFGRDLRKNLKRANKDHVEVREVKREELTEADKTAVEDGIQGWLKSRSGLQIATVCCS